MKKGEILPTVSEEEIEITDRLQAKCIKAFFHVLNQLKTGVTEEQIAKIARSELEKLGITDYWYDVPILVLIGSKRFIDMSKPNYQTKKPSSEIALQPDDTLFVDIHPRDSTSGRWGNFARTVVYNPQSSEKLKKVQQMSRIHRDSIASINSDMSVSQVAKMFDIKFQKDRISLLDVRNSYGHNMGIGEKDSFERTFITTNCPYSITGQIWGIEPSGVFVNQALVARIEDCIHVSSSGTKILGGEQAEKLIFAV